MRPAAITGVGVVSHLGIGWDDFRRALADAPPEVATPRAEGLDGAQIAGFDASKWLGDKGLRNNDRLTKLSLVTARLGLEHAGIRRDGGYARLDADRVGIVASTAYGSTEAIAENNRVAKCEDPRYLNPARFPNTVINSAFGYVSIWEAIQGLNVTVTNGPTGALDAVFCGATHLHAGRVEAVLVGGAESTSELLLQSLQRVSAFEGDGWPGEGAALFALEDSARARAAGLRRWGEVVGYGSAFGPIDDDARLVSPSALALVDAMREALDDAGLRADEIDVVASGAGGVWSTDEAELDAIARVLPNAAVSAPKRRLGETFGAMSALALAAALAWLDEVPVGDLVRGAAPRSTRHVMLTAMGYYGNAAALVVRRAE